MELSTIKEIISNISGIIPLLALFFVIKIINNKRKETKEPERTKQNDTTNIPEGLREKLIKQTRQYKPLPTSIGQALKDLKYVNAFSATTQTGQTTKKTYHLKPSTHAQLFTTKKATLGKCYHYTFNTGFLKEPTNYIFCTIGQDIIELIREEQQTTIKKNNRTIALLDHNKQTIKNDAEEIIGKRTTTQEIIATPNGERQAEEHININERQIATILAKPIFKLFGKQPDDHQLANTRGLHGDEAAIVLGIILERTTQHNTNNPFTTIKGPGSLHT